MRFNFLKRFHQGEKGFTFFELLIATAIAMIIGAGVTTTIFQVLNTNARSTNHMVAVREAQNAGYWVSRDAQMAQRPYDDITPASPDFLYFHWVEWDGTEYEVTYSFSDNKLVRSEDRNGVAQPDLTVAEHIKHGTGDLDDSVPQFDTGTSVLTVSVTAAVGSGSQQVSETREYQIKPRPSA